MSSASELVRVTPDSSVIPAKLLDAPVLDVHWPEDDAFSYIGNPLRIDYTTDLHGQPTKFSHRMTTGSKVYWPYLDLSELDSGFGGKPVELSPSIDPIQLGFRTATADRIYFITRDGRQLIFARKELPIVGEHAEASFMVGTLDPSVVAWDPDNSRLLIVSKGRNKTPLFVMQGGGLSVNSGAMILG